MYRAFNLKSCDWSKILPLSEAKQEAMNSQVKESFQSFRNKGEINGTLLQSEWFPKIESDVFISHSHDDREDALSLAGWLDRSFGLRTFIDSSVWGNSQDLLRDLDNEYCTSDDEDFYRYEDRNRTTSHVHMMLATALSRMIDACECVIFVSSPNSVSTSSGSESTVSSPWIFYELSQMELIEKRTPEDHRGLFKEAATNFSIREAALKVKYDVDFKSLTQIDGRSLKAWRESFSMSGARYALDLLYELNPI